MNRENVEYVIALLREPKAKVFMSSWQHRAPREPIATTEALQLCGTAACLGGHIACSKKFQEEGGTMDKLGAPICGGHHGPYAVAVWLEIDDKMATSICACDNESFYGVPDEYVTKEMVIEKLEELLND